ncbi:MAG: hypothetical protein ACOX83_10765 [Candidatus Spyradocola sp.]|jgi:hypothetical protein
MTLYEAAWKLTLCLLSVVGGFGALWLSLELIIGYCIDQAEDAHERTAKERRRRAYDRIARRYGRAVK